MKLISEEKIESNRQNLVVFDENSYMQGINFAENELKDLAFEFSEWKDRNVTKEWSGMVGFKYTIKGDKTTYFWGHELLDKFIEQR